MNIEHFRKLEKMYLNANIQKMLFETTAISISEGSSEITLDIHKKYFHALNAIHGCIYFKLLDDSAYFAANSIVEDYFLLTTNFTTQLTRPASKGSLKAVGKVRFISKNLWIAESTIYNNGKEIGFGTGHFAKSKIQLTEEIGYF